MMLRDQLVEFNASQRTFPLRTASDCTPASFASAISAAPRIRLRGGRRKHQPGSRLEGLNKLLGTDVLATRQIQKAVEGKFASRRSASFGSRDSSGRPKSMSCSARAKPRTVPRPGGKPSHRPGVLLQARFRRRRTSFRDTIRLRKAVPSEREPSRLVAPLTRRTLLIKPRSWIVQTCCDGTVRAPGAAPDVPTKEPTTAPRCFIWIKSPSFALRLASGWIGEVH